MSLTTDPNHPDVKRGSGDEQPVPQNKVYLVLSEEERAKGFTRPYRDSYVHVGPEGPKHPLRALTQEEKELYGFHGYIYFEVYPESELPKTGRFWTQKELDSVGKGCNSVTTMARAIAETYARNPRFYGATYCVGCLKHRPVGEFVWVDGRERVGS